MADQNFVDRIRIFCQSGNGGAGSSHFRREKFVPLGGPDGGDGGRGGHVIIRGNRNRWTLLHLKFQKHNKAGHGQPGAGQRCSGHSGEDIILDVPLGTVIKDEDSGKVLLEINEHDEELILFEGGLGGRGNWHFKTSTNQAPTYAQPGTSGQEGWVTFELKLLADVGLVGFPNAGKSTLLSVVSAARPKIASYAFTTLTPNLGMVSYRDDQSFVMADIPGIIEGASEGKGLGIRFLRHIERNACLLFLVPADADNIVEAYKVLLAELEAYNPELILKERVLGISKADLIDDELQDLILKELQAFLPEHLDVVFFSSVSGQGVAQLKDVLWRVMNY
ncbi:MAG: GTPase ObgE [Bacteroidota bacterium]|nr:GTPase ObgE [Bacteroidota bacterium]